MKYLFFFFLIIPLISHSQSDSYYTNGARRPHIRVDSLTANKTDSIAIGDKLYYSVVPSLTKDFDIPYKSWVESQIAALSYWPKSGNFANSGAQTITLGGQLIFNGTSGFTVNQSAASIDIQASGNGFVGLGTNNQFLVFDPDNTQGFGSGTIFFDLGGTPLGGIKYDQDYSNYYNDLSLPDWLRVREAISDSIASLPYIPLEGTVTTTDQLTIAVQDDNQLVLENEAGSSAFQISTIGTGTNRTTFDFVADSIGQKVRFRIANDSTRFLDQRAVKRGIEYAGTGYVTQDHSLADKEYVDNAVSSVSTINESYVSQSLDSISPLRIVVDTVNINDWNMYSTGGGSGVGTKDIVISSLSWDKILGIQAWIKNDNNNTSYPINRSESGGGSLSGSLNYNTGGGPCAVRLEAFTSGFFDSTDFNATGFNRGWIIIWYLQ